MRYIFLLALASLSMSGYSQTRWVKLTGGLVLTDPKVRTLEADDGFSVERSGVGYRIGLIYDQYLDSEERLGFRTGLYLVKKKASLHFETVQSYEEINNSSARLDVSIDAIPIYSVVELPIAFLYKKSLAETNSFFSFAGGASLDWVKGSSLVTNTDLELFNPQGTPQQFSIQTTDDFAFDSHISYSLLASVSYNFLLKNQRYVEIGLSCHFSPVRTDTLSVTYSINDENFSGNYQSKRLSYLQVFVSYSLTRLEFNRYL